MRIFTGGVVPEGADAVVIQEDTARDGDAVTVTEAARPGRHVRPAGIDFREGDVLLPGGLRLTDRDLSLAAAMNHPALPVHRRPKVALLATGDELVMPGQHARPRADRLFQRLRAAGAGPPRGRRHHRSRHRRRHDRSHRRGIRRARDAGADVLVTTGGASVGDYDLVKRSLEAEGVTMAFWKIAMRPGKPMMHGRLGAMRVIGLPGNPVSSYVCGFLFLVPLIRALVRAIGESSTPARAALLGRDRRRQRRARGLSARRGWRRAATAR